MANVLNSGVSKSTTWSIAVSALMIVAGLLAIALPVVAGVTVTVILGWLLLLSGGLHVAFAWSGGRTGAVVWEILLGLVYGAIGFYLLARPVAGLESVTFALAIYLFLEGALELTLSFLIRPLPGSGWLVIDGIITLVLAGMIWSTWPSASGWAVGTLVGISMLFSGMTRLMLSFGGRRILA